MANVNYNEGVASVAPDATTPNDYLSSSAATPAAFGGQLAQGAERLGQGMTTASQFFGKVAADDASNQFQDFATKLLHGDPSKSTPGPDGQPVPDTGYLGLRGRAALDQRPQIEQQMDDRLKELRGNLSSPEQQLEFDNFTRRYRSMVSERIGTHADGQATVWYQGVNTASAKIAMDHIANNFDNPNEVAAGFQDLTGAYVKQAQLQGAQPGDPQYQEALQSARRDGLQAQLNAMAVKDPSRALAVLDKNKDIAGVKYDDMANSFRARADQQTGFQIGSNAIKKTYQNPALPPPQVQKAVFGQLEQKYNLPPGYLSQTNSIEGVGKNPRSSADGPFQFIDSTAEQYGITNKHDFFQTADGAARLAADNQAALQHSLGRPPTGAELYLAHQQGEGVAARLLANPNVRAGDVAGDKAIRDNGGNPNAPASDFTRMYTAKFNGMAGQAIQMRKASAYQDVMAIPDSEISAAARQHALTYVNQQMTAQGIAEEADSKARTAASWQENSQITSDILAGKTNGIIDRITNSTVLSGAEKRELSNYALAAMGEKDTVSFGPGYTTAFKRVMADQDDPSRIIGPRDLILMGPGGTGELTQKGVTKLLETQKTITKEPDQASVNRTKSAQLDYYRSKLGIDEENPLSALGKTVKNQKGLDRFNHDFVPAFEAAYTDWTVKQGKPAMDFLTDNKRIDAILDSVYPPSERNRDLLNGTQPAKPAPPAPAGTDEKAWGRIVNSPPVTSNGTPWPADKWAAKIEKLRADPTPEMQSAFDAKFGPSGYRASDILKQLPPPKGDVQSPDEAAGASIRANETHRSLLGRILDPDDVVGRSRAEREEAEKEHAGEPGMLERAASAVTSLANKFGPKQDLKPTGPTSILGIRG